MIRKARSQDISSVYNIYLQSAFNTNKRLRDGFFLSTLSIKDLKRYLQTSPCFVVYENNGKVAGFLITSQIYPSPPPQEVIKTTWLKKNGKKLFIQGRGILIDFIGVEKQSLRQGIGKKLLAAVYEYVKYNKISAIFTWITLKPVKNNSSISFFEKNGFIQTMISTKLNHTDLLLYKFR